MTSQVAGRKVVLIAAALGAVTIIAAIIIWRVAAPDREQALTRMLSDAVPDATPADPPPPDASLPPDAGLPPDTRPAPASGLDAEAVIAKVRGSYYEPIQKCYADALEARPGLQGRVEITIKIAPSGQVTDVVVNGFDRGMDACVKAAAKTWTFDNPERKAAAFSFHLSFVHQ